MDRSDRDQKPCHVNMTVANVRDTAGAESVDVVFLESARFFRLKRDVPNFHNCLRILNQAANKNATLRIGLQSEDSDLITEVAELTS